jgi:hypothetical protein
LWYVICPCFLKSFLANKNMLRMFFGSSCIQVHVTHLVWIDCIHCMLVFGSTYLENWRKSLYHLGVMLRKCLRSCKSLIIFIPILSSQSQDR